MTNADRIRSMSNEEMAEAMVGGRLFGCSHCPEDFEGLGDNPFAIGENCNEKCAEYCLAWLNDKYDEHEY